MAAVLLEWAEWIINPSGILHYKKTSRFAGGFLLIHSRIYFIAVKVYS